MWKMRTPLGRLVMAILRRKKYRTTEVIQAYYEDLILKLDTTEEFLLPGQKGYVEGVDTPNPHYLSKLDMDRLRLRVMGELKVLLPIHEQDEALAEMEAKLINLMQLIEERAPFLLQGVGSGTPH